MSAVALNILKINNISSDTNGTTPVDVKTEKKVPSTFTGKSFADVEHIVNADGNYLFCRSWKPDQDITYVIALNIIFSL